MKRLLKKALAVVCPALLSALGFTSCDLLSPKVEYGTPSCDFKVDITVVDEDSKPIKGIKAVPIEIYTNSKNVIYDQNRWPLDTLTSDSSGKVQHSENIIGITNKFTVVFEDVDGEMNGGTFKKDSMDFTPVQTKKGDGHWYEGEYTISGTKVLKKE